MDYTTSILEAQLDWVTATTLADRDRRDLGELAIDLLKRETQAGNQRNQWAFQGYKGWTAGRVDYGMRQDSDIVRLRGQLADAEFDRVKAATDRFTRLDLAVTCRYEPFTDELAKEKRAHLDYRKPGRGFTPSWQFIESSDDGDTLYLGSRSSQFFARVYNKQRQSHNPYYDACWRWEVECKQDAARCAGRDFSCASDRRAYVRAAVRNHFQRRGVPADWPADNAKLSGRPWAGEPDLERHKSYFTRTLKPLMAKYAGSAGYGILLETLGVPHELAEAASSAAALSERAP